MLLSEKRGHKEKLYLYEPNSFKPLAFVENNQCYFYHLDHLGTPQELTDWEGQVVWSVWYRTYGSVVRKDVDAVEDNSRFQGQYWDEETGLHYNRFRYYDPRTGQFTQQDPIGLLGGVNCYRYAVNPVSWIDPLGLIGKPGDCPDSEKNESLDKSKSVAETARIHHYKADEQNPYGHYSIKVSKGNETIHTHQIITARDKSSTTIVETIGYPVSKPLEKVVEVKIPNADQAMKYQEKMIWEELGPYNQKSNSCVDHVCEVLRQGGEPVKKGGIRQYKYLKDLGF
ncbi:RHS repeat domain-containing protein [Ketobacter sp.]